MALDPTRAHPEPLTVPQFALLAFALWTILVPLGAVAFYRWSRIIGEKAPINEFAATAPEGPDWYRCAMRAHANCVENLPVFGAIVLVLSVAAIASRALDILAATVFAARVGQSLVHIGRPQTAAAVSVRFTFFLIQVLCMIAMAVMALTAR